MAATNTTILGFDVQDMVLRMMSINGNAISRPQIENLPVDDRLINTGDYAAALEGALSRYSNIGALQQSAITLMLPDNLIGMDYINIPIMQKMKMAEALKTEFNSLYKNNAELQWINYINASNKKNATYSIAITNKNQLAGIQKAFVNAKLQPKVTTTFAAAGSLNAVFHLRQKIRRNNFLFIDIKERSTQFVMCGREHTMGFSSLPFGYEILSREEVNTEAFLFDHDMAELAVINATELAKKKKLTIDQDDLEQQENDAKAQQEAEAAAEAEARAEEEARARAEAIAKGEALDNETKEEEKNKEEKNEEDDFGFEGDDNQPKRPAAKVFAKKVPKRLPMFMQRPEPETEEAYILENFRIFEKRILLYKRQCDYEPLVPNPEFILINIPEEYAFVIDALNADEDNKVEFRYFNPATEGNPSITNNLELFGSYFANTYNKGLIF